MSFQSPEPSSDDADPEEVSTPAGVVEELEEMAEELGANTGPPEDDESN
jgi:hypothetical protein